MRFEKQKATQRFIEEFKGKREEWKRLERERLEEENRKILEFADMQQVREQDRMEKQKMREENKAEVQQKVKRFKPKGDAIGLLNLFFSLHEKLHKNKEIKKNKTEFDWNYIWRNKKKLKGKKKRFV